MNIKKSVLVIGAMSLILISSIGNASIVHDRSIYLFPKIPEKKGEIELKVSDLQIACPNQGDCHSDSQKKKH